MSWRLKGFRVKRTPPMTDWQDISTAPKGHVRVILYVPPYGAMSGHHDRFGPDPRWNCHACVDKSAQPTHWMPLPAPPTQKGAA